jgi:hypothetical protein
VFDQVAEAAEQPEKGEESAKNIDADEPYRTSDLPKIMVFTSSYLSSGRCHN